MQAADGVRVQHIVAGPFEGLTKDELPGQLCAFARDVLRTEASHDPGYYDVVHSHYWLSGQVGALARDRWGIPLVHSMHTMAKVKNEALAEGDTPEPIARVIGEEQVVAAADMLIANTDDEARQLVTCYDADATRVEVVHPGVDLDVFRPTSQAQARTRLGIAPDAPPARLRRPDPAAEGARRAAPRRRRAGRPRPVAALDAAGGGRRRTVRHRAGAARVAGPAGRDRSASSDVVRFVPPVSRTSWSTGTPPRHAVCVPSYNESFGLVAVEAQAVGTPVVAAAVGGLTTAVRDGHSGLLVGGHDPADYARAFERIVRDARPARRAVAAERWSRPPASAGT